MGTAMMLALLVKTAHSTGPGWNQVEVHGGVTPGVEYSMLKQSIWDGGAGAITYRSDEVHYFQQNYV